MKENAKKDFDSNLESGHGKRRKVTLSAKLLGFTVGLLAIAVLSLGLIAINLGSAAIINQANAEAEAYAIQGAAHVGETVDGNLTLLEEVASQAKVASMDWNTQVEAIAGDVEKMGYQDIAVMDKSGHAKNVIDGQEFNSKGQLWYEEGFKGESAISDIVISQVTNEPIIVEVAPIKSNGEVVGLLVGRRDPNFYSSITTAMGDGKRVYGFILSNEGQFIAHPDPTLVKEQTNVIDQIETDGPFKSVGLAMQKLGVGETGMVSYVYKGENKIAAAAPIPGSNWSLVVTKYESDVMAPMNQLRNIILFISLGILIAGGVAAYIFAQKMSKPVKAANHMVQEMKQGHLSDRLENKSTDEIGEMSLALNQFADNLQNVVIHSMNKIADGDVSANIVATDEKDEISPALQQIIVSIRGLIEEAAMLAKQELKGASPPEGMLSLSRAATETLWKGSTKPWMPLSDH